jgi:hypothetical protein
VKSVPKFGLVALLCGLLLAGAWLAFEYELESEPPAPSASSTARVVNAAVERSTTAIDPESAPSAVRQDVSRADTASSTPAASTDELVCVLRVVDELGAALADAKVLVLDAKRELREASAAGDGRVRLAARNGDGDVFVSVSNRPLEHFRADLGPGERTLGLTQIGERVAGLVTVNGATPPETLKLELEAAGAPFASLELPKELRAKLAEALRRRCSTDSGGNFEFIGLPADWSGFLVVLPGYCAPRNGATGYGVRHFPLERPATNLVFDLERLPRLIGRVVDESGAPAAEGLKVHGMVYWPDSGGMGIGVPIGEDGRFHFVLREPQVKEVQLTLETPQARTSVTLAGEELVTTSDGDLDAGTLVLRTRRALQVRVLETAGRGIDSAKARIVGERAWSTSDASGAVVVLTAASGAARLRVAAVGYWAEEVDVALPTGSTVEVVLAKSNRLALRIVDAKGEALKDVLVRLASRGPPLFPDSNTWWPDDTMIGVVSGDQRGAGQNVAGEANGWVDLGPDRDGRIVVQGLAPGVNIDLSVLDSLQEELVTQRLAPLTEASSSELEIVVSHELRAVAGRITDGAGQPLAKVSIAARGEGAETLETTTDDEGRYSLRGIAAKRVRLRATARGFAPKLEQVVELSSASSTLDLVLERN